MVIERELLSQCGLNETEQTILLYLLEHGRTRASLIAQRTGIKRPTVYSALASLSDRGLVGRHVDKKTTLYSAMDPETIPGVFITRAKGDFERVTQAALQLESHLKEFKLEGLKRIGGYEISTLDSREATFAYLESVLVRGHYRAIFNPQTAFAEPRAKEAGERCLNITARSKAPMREIAVSGPLCKWWIKNIRNPNHEVKEVKMTPSLLTDILLSEGTVILTNYDPGREMCILIKHPDYYQFMTEMFDLFWTAI